LFVCIHTCLPACLSKQIRMPRPDTGGRYDILRLQLASKDVAPDVDLLQLARDLPGLVGADLANIVNEAQLSGELAQVLSSCVSLGLRCGRGLRECW
jgi:SpoVK/Ycf46/Vps4 family AAA+-type ATPase